MKITISVMAWILMGMVITSELSAQVNAIAFSQIDVFQSDNQNIKTGKRPRAVFFGNSITEGFVKAVPDFFEINHYIGRGISGQTTSQGLLRFRKDVLELNPEVVLINLGINDIAENTGPYDEGFTLGHLISMVELAKANNIKVVLASVLPASNIYWRPSVENTADKVISLNQSIKMMADQYGLIYLDYHTALKNSENGLDKELAEDGVHPTLKCYKIMATLAEEAIQKAINP